MTTEAAANLYLAQHLYETEGRKNVIYNPNNKPIEELPVIMGFNNGGSPGLYSAVAVAEDGKCLGGHCCSHEGYMPYDLGIIENARSDRHKESYQKHYPEGYRMEWIPSDRIAGHEKLQKVIKMNKEQKKEDL
jgi:hypothetical protein